MCESIYLPLSKKYESSFEKPFDIILKNKTDFANGYYTIIPYPHIVLYITPWANARITSNLRSELKSLFTHELTHALTLSQIEGPLAMPLKILFNRASVALLLPQTFVEGIAMLEESSDESGRLYDPFHQKNLLADLHCQNCKPSLSDVEGRQDRFPHGSTPYIYGGFFLKHLQKKYGIEKIREFYKQTRSYVPYFYANLFQKIFGNSLEDEWKTWQQLWKQNEKQTNKNQTLVKKKIAFSH